MDIERVIGADIIMALDECPPGKSDYAYAKNSLGLTQRWLDRCFKRFRETEPLYGYPRPFFLSSRAAPIPTCGARRLSTSPTRAPRAMPLADWPWASPPR